MSEPFLNATTLYGQERVRSYVLGWLERLDYAGRLDRAWPADELGRMIWERVERDFRPHCSGEVVSNRPIAEVIATVMVEDYYAAYPERRSSRYSVGGPFGDEAFRRCVLDFLHDLEEFDEPEAAAHPHRAADAFWEHVREHPQRWGCSGARGAFVDDEPRARGVVLETLLEYRELMRRAEESRGG